jgi:nucleoside-diphosphate-sugar epimerase
MVIAVTGANGFIGRRLCHAIESEGESARRVVRADFVNEKLVERFSGADVVIHAAAATRAPSHADLWRSNVELTRQTIEAARAAGVRRLVFVSSQAAAGPARSLAEPVTEADAPIPIEEYGRTKLAGERLVAEARELEAVIVRPSSVYGAGDRDFRVLVALARRGVAIHPGNREQWISIIHVDDCVRGILAAARMPEAVQRTYFLANDAPVQWGELFRLAAAANGRSRLWLDVEVPAALVEAGAVVGDVLARLSGTAGLLTSEKVKLSRAPYWVCSNARAKRELGFVQQKMVTEGLRL